MHDKLHARKGRGYIWVMEQVEYNLLELHPMAAAHNSSKKQHGYIRVVVYN